MDSKRIQYNLPGCGLLYANLFGYTQKLIAFFDNYGHIGRLHRLNQLGRLRDVFPGAHHNRYEYVFLQWALVTEITEQKDANLGLGTERPAFGTLSDIGKPPTSAEVLQCLILLMNIGHLDGTFASSRAWINTLKSNRKVYNHFKNGMTAEDVPFFKKVVEEFDIYKFHLVMALFMLQRYKRFNAEYVEFCSGLLRAYTKNSSSDGAFFKIWELYRNIRQISFLALDSFYAPVPFTLDMSSIMVSFKFMYKDMLVQSQVFQSALRELETVLQNTVYLSPNALLKTSQATEEIEEELRRNKKLELSIGEIKNCVVPNSQAPVFNHFEAFNDWDENKTLLLIYDNCAEFEPDVMNDQVNYENKLRKKVGKTFCRFSILRNPNRNMIRLCVALKEISPEEEVKSALKIIGSCIDFTSSFKENYKEVHSYRPYNANGIFEYALKSIFGWDKRYILSKPIDGATAFIGESGRVEFVNRIESYLDKVKGYIDVDSVFEITEFKKMVETISFSGYMLGFLGATRIYSNNKNTEAAEFDGVLIKVNHSPHEPFIYILESKNKVGGKSEARAQLTKRLKEQLQTHLESTVIDLSPKSVYAPIKLKP
jgi:hypothetical protein